MSVPAGRIAELRMPIQWLCSDFAEPQTMSDGQGGEVTRVISTCANGQACRAGECVTVDDRLDPLPPFDARHDEA